MEPTAAASDTDWSSFGAMMQTEDMEMMALLFDGENEPDQNQEQGEGDLPVYWHSYHTVPACFSSNDLNSLSWPQLCPDSADPSYLASHPDAENYYSNLNGNPQSRDCPVPGEFTMMDHENRYTPIQMVPDFILDEPSCYPDGCDYSPSKQERSPTERSDDISELNETATKLAGNQQKRPRASAEGGRKGKNARPKKAQKGKKARASDERNTVQVSQTLSGYSTDDSSASQEINGTGNGESTSSKESEMVDSNIKTRAGRGSATDPQSLYARKRRERINERLKILQNLVPNGTKVDISTMLEEAVQYVKFLQLQIKLLSSDDLWMYAPIAYNGMNIGLDLKIRPPQ